MSVQSVGAPRRSLRKTSHRVNTTGSDTWVNPRWLARRPSRDHCRFYGAWLCVRFLLSLRTRNVTRDAVTDGSRSAYSCGREAKAGWRSGGLFEDVHAPWGLAVSNTMGRFAETQGIKRTSCQARLAQDMIAGDAQASNGDHTDPVHRGHGDVSIRCHG